jgi:translation initiation factor IF-2
VQELTGDASQPAEGIIVEANRDPQRGISATFIIKDGSLSKGMYCATEGAWTPVRAIADTTGALVDTASFSSPVVVVGWSALPTAGASVRAFDSKKEAEAYASIVTKRAPSVSKHPATELDETGEIALIPVILKADVAGSLDAMAHEIAKLSDDRVTFKILHGDVGAIGENDIKRAGGDERTVIVGFNTKLENGVREMAERAHITIETDSIIYKLTEKLEAIRSARRPKRMVEEESGTAKILKLFAASHNKQVVGARVETGTLKSGDTVTIVRRTEAIGKGKILELQQGKQRTATVEEGVEFGTKIDSPIEIAPGDQIVAFTSVER